MAFNLDHTSSGNLELKGGYAAFTGMFSFPKPLQNCFPSVLLSEEAANIDSIVDLQSCLNLLVNTDDIGSASTLDADNSADNAILVNQYNLINNDLLPNSILSDVCVIANTGQLILLSQAKKGSFAITSNNFGTYVLCDAPFSNINNWTPLLNPDNCVDKVNNYTGLVCIHTCDLNSSAGYGSTVDSALEYIKTGYKNSDDLCAQYVTANNFDTYVSNYSTCNSLNTELLDYAGTGVVTGCLSCYSNNSATGSLLSPYVLKCTTGTAAYLCNVGTGSCCILCVNELGFVDESTISSYSITETFIISSYSDLATLTTATVGDKAFDTVNHVNYILNNNSEWLAFSAEEGSLLMINNQTASCDSIAFVYSCHITGNFGFLTGTISEGILDLDTRTTCINSVYSHSGAFTGTRDSYVTSACFNELASGKSTTGHGHAITDVTDLNSCITTISPFREANLINLEKSDSYTLSPNSSTIVSGSLMLGNQSKSVHDFSVVQAPGKFAQNGDAQYSSLVESISSPNANWNDIIKVDFDVSSLAVLNANFVSRIGDAFILQGSVAREYGNVFIPQEFNRNIYSTGNIDHDVRVCVGSDNFALQVKGNTIWTSSLEMVSVKTIPAGETGIYWTSVADSSWFNLNNWYTENTFVNVATVLPAETSDVLMFGSMGAVVDLDCASWVLPASIDTTNSTDPNGIYFCSATGAAFCGTVYGTATFCGNATFR